jgi:hypothetical protein
VGSVVDKTFPRLSIYQDSRLSYHWNNRKVVIVWKEVRKMNKKYTPWKLEYNGFPDKCYYCGYDMKEVNSPEFDCPECGAQYRTVIV